MYNENIFDLLDEPPPGALGPRPALKLKEDSKGRVFVAGLSEVRIGRLLRTKHAGATIAMHVHAACPATVLITQN